MNPMVSICVPAYRQKELLARTLASVFTQRYRDFEVIVTDDSETDEIEAEVACWTKDERFRYSRNSVRLGSPANWNQAMSLARGKYIKLLHHDDWFSDEFSLGIYVDALELNPSVSFAFSAANACRDDGTLLFVHRPSAEQIASLKRDAHVLIHANFVGAPSATIFRSSATLRFNEALKWVVDIDAYVRLLGTDGLFVFIPEPLISITSEGPHQVTRQVIKDPVLRIAEHLYLYRNFKSRRGRRVTNFYRIIQLLSGLDRSGLEGVRLHHHLAGVLSIEVHVAMLTRGIRLLATKIRQVLSKFKRTVIDGVPEAPRSYSQCGEDMIIDFLFMWLGVKDVHYLDIGANHPTRLSNTYYFYQRGHKGVLVEPDVDLCGALARSRPRDTILNIAVGVDDSVSVKMYVMTSRTLNTLDSIQAHALENSGKEQIEKVVEVEQQGINEILERNFRRSPNLVSLDVEGLDLGILKQWDFGRFRPEIFCVETLTYTRDNTEQKLTDIIDFMEAKNYRTYADTFVNTIFVCEEAWSRRPICQ